MSADLAPSAHFAANVGKDTDDEIKESFTSALSSNYRGIFTADVSKLRLTMAGRPLREAGIKDMIRSIANDGWLTTSMPVVAFHQRSDEGHLAQEDSVNFLFCGIDGNHRGSSLQQLLLRETGEGAKVDLKLLATEINVHVYVGLSDKAERIIVDRFNTKSSILVERTVCDSIFWYRKFCVEAKAINTGCDVVGIMKYIRQQHHEMGARAPYADTLRKYVEAVLNLSQQRIEALQDVTHLPGRSEKHRDLRGLDYWRVPVSALRRKEFGGMSGSEQKAYIYKLAAKFRPRSLRADDYEQLDKACRHIARAESAICGVAPKGKWSRSFAG